jgi:hypothetical protein
MMLACHIWCKRTYQALAMHNSGQPPACDSLQGRGLQVSMLISLWLVQSYVHTTEEDRAEYFRQWGRQLDKETTVLREAVGAGMLGPMGPANLSKIMHSLSTAWNTTGLCCISQCSSSTSLTKAQPMRLLSSRHSTPT